jgi:hypothetical protein
VRPVRALLVALEEAGEGALIGGWEALRKGRPFFCRFRLSFRCQDV